MVFSFNLVVIFSLLPSLMPTGLAALMTANPLLAFAPSLDLISSLGTPRSSLPFPVPALKLSMRPLLMLLPN